MIIDVLFEKGNPTDRARTSFLDLHYWNLGFILFFIDFISLSFLWRFVK
jgi:hypothetical protein